MSPRSDTSETIDIVQRVRWYVAVRLFFLLSIGTPGLLSLYFTEGWTDQVQRDAILLLVALMSNVLFYGLTRTTNSPTYQRYLAIAWITIDITLITTLIFTKGGIESRSPILYTFPILIAAAIFGRKATYITASAAAIIYSSLIVFDYLGIITSVGAIDPTLRSNLPYVINTICFFPAILLVIAMAADFITKLLQKQQRQTREHFEALERAQETAKLGSWEWDIMHDTITWSTELYNIYGLDPAPAPLRFDTYLELIHPDDISAQHKIISAALKKKQPFTVDHRIILPDGSVKYIHGEGRPLFDKKGNVTKLTGIAQDVTDKHHLDMAKREFVSLASHQLRTPASGVKAFLSLLLDGHAGKLPSKQRSFIRKAYESNVRQLEIIDNLLNLASVEAGKFTINKTVVDLRDIVDRCLSQHLPNAKEKKQKLVFHKPISPLPVSADPSYLQMAIDNLISNALKYTPAKGTVTVSLENTRSTVYLTVADTGIGIAATDIPLLFQKFSRINNPTSDIVDGTGLGLYLAKHIIELHGGNIRVRSKPGEGTQFRMKLRLLPAKRYTE